jgi:hypothetical protein
MAVGGGGGVLLVNSEIYYVPETHIMFFIRRCWFLKCSEEIHYVPIGDGGMWYYVPVDDGWEEVLGRNVYITSQYWDIMYTVGSESLCRAESLCRNNCISYFRHLELR